MTTTIDDPLVAETSRTRLAALPRRPLLVAAGAIVLALAGVWWIALPPSSVSTDDAYLKADSTIIAPKVHGLVSEILVHDNQWVKAGQPLVRIDGEEYSRSGAIYGTEGTGFCQRSCCGGSHPRGAG